MRTSGDFRPPASSRATRSAASGGVVKRRVPRGVERHRRRPPRLAGSARVQRGTAMTDGGQVEHAAVASIDRCGARTQSHRRDERPPRSQRMPEPGGCARRRSRRQQDGKRERQWRPTALRARYRCRLKVGSSTSPALDSTSAARMSAAAACSEALVPAAGAIEHGRERATPPGAGALEIVPDLPGPRACPSRAAPSPRWRSGSRRNQPPRQ